MKYLLLVNQFMFFSLRASLITELQSMGFVVRKTNFRLMVLLATVAALASGTVGAFGVASYRNALVEGKLETLRSTARTHADKIEQSLAAWRHLLAELSAETAVGERIEAAWQGHSVTAAGASLLEHLMRYPWSAAKMMHVTLVDVTGHVIDTTDPTLSGRDLGVSDWFRTAIERLETVKGAPMDEAPALSIDMTRQIRDDSVVRGLIWVRLTLVPLFAGEADRAAPGQVVISGRNWRDDVVVLWPPSSSPDELEREAVRPTRTDRPSVLALRGIEGDLLDGMVDRHGNPVLAVTRRLSSLDWGLAVQSSRDEIWALVEPFGRRLLLVGFMAVGLATLAAASLGHWILSPLRRLLHRSEAIVRSIADGVITADKRGEILTANPAAANMFGWTPEDLVGQQVDVLMPADAREPHRRAMDTLRKNSSPHDLDAIRDVQAVRRDGTVFTAEILLNRFSDGDGSKFIAVLRDIGDRREADHQMKLQITELNQTNGELERTNAELRRQSQGAHQFVDNVSHEFRTPLAVIKEYVQILRDHALGPLNEEQIAFADVILQRADDLNIMVNDMLDISKLNAGLLGISRHPCTFESIVERCRPVLENRARAVGINLGFDLSPHLPELFADTEKISRIIINLAVNACKFTDQGGHVRIWARNDDRAAQIVVGVTDDGPGIAPENLKAIFERFQQIGDVRRSTKGFGLGLAITKELVEISLGDISVDSKPGEGSTFWFTIPAAEPVSLLDRFARRSGSLRRDADHFALIAVDAGGMSGQDILEDIDDVLRLTLRSSDLMLRVSSSRWSIVSALSSADASEIQYRLESEIGRIAEARTGERSTSPAVTVRGSWPITDDNAMLRRRFLETIGEEPDHSTADHGAIPLPALEIS